MSDKPITDDVAAALCNKLKKVELTEQERDLLRAILKIARDVTGPSEKFDKDLDADFGNCFEPGQAAVIVQYLTTEHSITKHVGTASVARVVPGPKSITGRHPHLPPTP
jgi:hypothetical protein